ncbi:MAG: alpha-hydroxy-acid oxidizing enzyme [Gemmatimonadetes bacterium]|jgi:isopentenyl diphosphate isomerase/L-lactate dehydrogenase-like FMN-dependent dehydrogenase|nr:alpha-hydroxy-acid oxidizing enzyme [Gemmatimonadota bacterium]HCK11532.1 alpha-hydroxy-acid oxidizing enzyme [Candidatus Latescibacterota bacterium]
MKRYERRYTCVADLETAALKRLPKFVHDYLAYGIGNGVGVRKNREELDEVELMPKYLSEIDQPNYGCNLLGREYDAPFGVAPIGLAGLVWPKAEAHLASTAANHNIPFTLSTVAMITLENARQLAAENTWFQLYTPQDPAIRKDLIKRCADAGYDTLIVTVDVPYGTRREHDIRNGLSVPPSFNLRTLWQMMIHPPWALRMLASGVPKFVNLAPYYDAETLKKRRSEIHRSARFIKNRMGVHITRNVFGEIRSQWSGNLLVKGVLDPEEASVYANAGADGVIVSNHGGRQLDAAPTAVSVLTRVREAVGPDYPIIADGGVRSGLDIARMIALGANFVLMGRAFMFAVAALDKMGPDHLINTLKAELQSTMGQLGCPSLANLPDYLVRKSVPI